jgi:DNA polymerase (family 10)
MTASEIGAILDEMGTLLELKGENPFKCRAFHNAARAIGASSVDLASAATAGTLTDIPGVGKGIAPIIADLALRGASKDYESLRKSLPRGLVELLSIQGLGPKKVRLLHERLKIDGPAALKKAASAGKLATLEGFGAKSEENILRGLDLLAQNSGKRLFPEAEVIAGEMLAWVRSAPGLVRCEIAGSLRRRKEVVGDIDLLAAAPVAKAGAILARFLAHPSVEAVLGSGPTKGSVILKGGVQCDLRVVSVKEYPFALFYFTGSKEHNVEVRALAGKRGWSLNEYGFTTVDGAATAKGKAAAKKTARKPPSCESEEGIYKALGLAFIPPELREATGEVVVAAGGKMPDLIDEGDIRGTFHCHTTFSDGRNTLREMADAAVHLKWKYLGIADHSKAAAYAGGLSAADVRRQLKEIDTLNGLLGGFRIFAGTEVDILPDGTLDWNDGILSGFDYVVASIHSKFGMTQAEATGRVVSALKNRHVTMLGHPTGRLLLAREGYPVDVRQVIDAASDYGKMIEINANPNRLDLDWRYCRYAAEKGVMIVINPDAHSTAGLTDVRYGVNVARKGWLRARDVLNTRSLAEVLNILKR